MSTISNNNNEKNENREDEKIRPIFSLELDQKSKLERSKLIEKKIKVGSLEQNEKIRLEQLEFDEKRRLIMLEFDEKNQIKESGGSIKSLILKTISLAARGTTFGIFVFLMIFPLKTFRHSSGRTILFTGVGPAYAMDPPNPSAKPATTNKTPSKPAKKIQSSKASLSQKVISPLTRPAKKTVV